MYYISCKDFADDILKDANADLIKRSINKFNWKAAFGNKTIDGKVSLFNKTFLNILSSFIPSEITVCDDKVHHVSKIA